MPSIFSILGYKVFFWSNENNEPLHVHVTKGQPSKNAAKIWLTRDGGCILASNQEKISAKDMAVLMEIIEAQFFMICIAWKKHFKTEEIKFYC